MMRRMSHGLVSAAIVVIAGLTAVGAASAQGTGYYTQAQAASGASIYAAKCSQCHGVKLEGGAGPTLVGSTFIKKYLGTSGTAKPLHDFISTQMPVDKPGSLSA